MGVDKPGSRAWTNVLKAVFLRRGGVIPKGSGVSLGGEIHDGLLGRRVRIGSRAYLRRMRELAAEAAPFDISGGTITTPAGYKVATLTSSGTLTVTGSGWLYYEMVAGGGGGAIGRGGGGGAGEIKRGSMFLTAGTYAVSIGEAGLSATAFQSPSAPGGDTTALGLTCKGGGRGGYYSAPPPGGDGTMDGGPGGSGGGAGGLDALAPAASGGASLAAAGGLGYPGGANWWDATSTEQAGGGGGGAGGPGGNAAENTAGLGGVGVASTCPGVSAIYAKGGTGGALDHQIPADGLTPGSGGDGRNAAANIRAGNGAKGIGHFWIEAAA